MTRHRVERLVPPRLGSHGPRGASVVAVTLEGRDQSLYNGGRGNHVATAAEAAVPVYDAVLARPDANLGNAFKGHLVDEDAIAVSEAVQTATREPGR